jgi:hypothetical protein
MSRAMSLSIRCAILRNNLCLPCAIHSYYLTPKFCWLDIFNALTLSEAIVSMIVEKRRRRCPRLMCCAASCSSIPSDTKCRHRTCICVSV